MLIDEVFFQRWRTGKEVVSEAVWFVPSSYVTCSLISDDVSNDYPEGHLPQWILIDR